MLTARCSSLPMLFRCAPSQEPQALAIEAYNAAAGIGTAVHDAMRSVVAGIRVDLDLIALRHGVNADEMKPLVYAGMKLWGELAPSFPNARTEIEVAASVGKIRLTGHIDVLSVGDREARGLDWKSGRKEEADYYAQLLGYAVCLLLMDESLERVVFSVAWLRSQSVETYIFTRQDAVEFIERLQQRVDAGRYVTGEHCGHCQRSHHCPALIATSRRDMAIFGVSHQEKSIAQGWIDEIDAGEVISVRRRVKALESFAASLDQAIRRRITTAGPLDSGDGYQLALVEENGKRVLDTAKAWPVVTAHLDDDEMASVITLSASKIDDLVAEKAPPRKGKAAKGQLRAELEAAGAITQEPVSKLREVRLPKLLNEKDGTNG